MNSTQKEDRFRYAHGLVWDNDRSQGVPRAKKKQATCDKVASLSVWTPAPRVLHVYQGTDGSVVWDWEPTPPGGRFAR